MHRQRALLLSVLALAVVLPGCAALNGLLKKGFQKPTLTFKTARLREASLGGATVDLVYTLKNPNPIGLSLASIDYTFFVEDKQLVAGKPANGLKLRSSGSSDLVFPASVRFQELAPALGAFLSKDVARYRAQGSVGIKTPLGVLNFPLSREGTFEVPKLPQVSLQPPRISNLSLSGATVEFPLVVVNRNSFPLPLGALTGALNVGGANVGQLTTPDLGLLDASGQRQVTVPLTISFARAASAASALRSGSGTVSFQGNVSSGGVAVPLSFSQATQFLRK